MDLRIKRETCICEMPRRSPISAWVRSSWKRSRRISRSRSGKRGEQRLHDGGVLGVGIAGVDMPAEHVDRRVAVLGERPIERIRTVRGACRQRFHDLLDCGAGALREFARSRRAAELGAEAARLRIDLDLEFLDRARDVNRPAEVAEVALELADDRRDGKRRERQAALDVVAIDRLQQRVRRDLLEIVALGMTLIAAREVTRQRQEPSGQLRSDSRVAITLVAEEQLRLLERDRPLARDVIVVRDVCLWCRGLSEHVSAIPEGEVVQTLTRARRFERPTRERRRPRRTALPTTRP